MNPAQLEKWMAALETWTPWGTPRSIGTYGSRGFDLSTIQATLPGAGRVEVFDGRFDIWSEHPDTATRVALRRHYWTVSASLHYFFTNVLTYFHHRTHHTHIHVDNSAPVATARAKHVQACCSYIWGCGTPITGVWDARTTADSTWVLRKAGVKSGDITTNWLTFNDISTRQGSGAANWL